jgi:endonuclease/exonuclease/phosphatase family metal-dependent hydrolase
MSQFTVMGYNIEHMNKLFEDTAIKEKEKKRAQKIATVIKKINPHVLGICEAANDPQEHEHFIEHYLSDEYHFAHGKSRGTQNLVFYYRDPFTVSSVDAAYDFYQPWSGDIDDDGLNEQYRWERVPLEVTFTVGDNGPQILIILVHAKSKGVFDIVDFHSFEKVSLANRKRLVSQAIKFRERLDQLLKDVSHPPILVMGDMNDGPGLDPFEKMMGKSFMETVMGSVYYPKNIFYNALWTPDQKKRPWTVEFADPIVRHPLGWGHRVWIDHILVSPDMVAAQPPAGFHLVKDSGEIGYQRRDEPKASDHFPVYCKIEKN